MKADRLSHLLRSRMRIAHFVLLDAIAREGSLRKAAAAQGISQPAVTKTLREIEATLGGEVFERGPSGIRPTRLGDELVAASRIILADVERASRALVAAARGDAGLVRIGFIPFVSYGLLSAGTRSLAASGRYAFDLWSGTSTEVVAAIRERRCDCGLVRRFGTEGPGLLFHELYRQRAALVMARASRPKRDGSALAVLADDRVRWVLPPSRTPTRLAVERLFVSQRLTPPVPDVECFDVRLIELLLSQDSARVAILPEDVAGDLTAARDAVTSVPLAAFDLPPICLATMGDLQGDAVPTLLAAFRTYLREAGQAEDEADLTPPAPSRSAVIAPGA